MVTSKVLLILLSGLGVVHGLLLAFFLWNYEKGLRQANKILSLLLLTLSFRIGKSIVLEFVDEVHIKVIFLGLASLLLIGPLFYFYTRSVLEKSVRFNKLTALHFLPVLVAGAFGSWIDSQKVKTIPITFFACLFGLYYGHFLSYLIFVFRKVQKEKKAGSESKNAIEWLEVLAFALTALWIVYSLNLIEEKVPYILGPILYSCIAYGVTFLALRNGYLGQLEAAKYKTTAITDEEADELYSLLISLLVTEKLYTNPDLSLTVLSRRLKASPQKVSMAINSRFGSNFNGLINHYRIQLAQELMKLDSSKSKTIASIAFDVGFNSLTSFNAAFKKQTQLTPSAYRKEMIQQVA